MYLTSDHTDHATNYFNTVNYTTKLKHVTWKLFHKNDSTLHSGQSRKLEVGTVDSGLGLVCCSGSHCCSHRPHGLSFL